MLLTPHNQHGIMKLVQHHTHKIGELAHQWPQPGQPERAIPAPVEQISKYIRANDLFLQLCYGMQQQKSEIIAIIAIHHGLKNGWKLL